MDVTVRKYRIEITFTCPECGEIITLALHEKSHELYVDHIPCSACGIDYFVNVTTPCPRCDAYIKVALVDDTYFEEVGA